MKTAEKYVEAIEREISLTDEVRKFLISQYTAALRYKEAYDYPEEGFFLTSFETGPGRIKIEVGFKGDVKRVERYDDPAEDPVSDASIETGLIFHWSEGSEDRVRGLQEQQEQSPKFSVDKDQQERVLGTEFWGSHSVYGTKYPNIQW